jgi:protein TonB
VRAESIIKVLPTYPTLPKRQRFAGTVMLEADIDENGSVVRARAISGPNQLRKAAEEALMKWKFRPASFNGIAVASKERIPIVLEPPR